MRRTILSALPFLLVAASLLSAPLAAKGQAPSLGVPTGLANITLRPGDAVVREGWKALFTSSVVVCRFAGLPVTVNHSGVIFDGSRNGLELVEWTRALSDAQDPVRVEGSGRSVRFDFPFDARPVAGTEMLARIRASRLGELPFDMIYPLTGITWGVSYQVIVRGGLTDFTNTLSVDVEGQVKVVNTSDRSFSNTAIRLLMPDTSGRELPRKEPGFLYLEDDSPLSDLWRYEKADPMIPHVYDLPGNHEMPSGRMVSMLHVSMQRKPVIRKISIQAHGIPTDGRGASGSPRLMIRLRNESDGGKSDAIPPGPVFVYLGSQQSTIYQKAWFNHTPAGGDIEIDMGYVDDISLRRMTGQRIERAGGGYEQSYEIRIDNRLTQAVEIYVKEKPPLDVNWSFLRSSSPVERAEDSLVFLPKVPAGSQLTLQYAVRVEEFR